MVNEIPVPGLMSILSKSNPGESLSKSSSSGFVVSFGGSLFKLKSVKSKFPYFLKSCLVIFSYVLLIICPISFPSELSSIKDCESMEFRFFSLRSLSGN